MTKFDEFGLPEPTKYPQMPKVTKMNERIRDLAEQAGITTNIDTDYFEKDINKWVDYYSQKFAELIVQECADIALREDHDPAECILTYFGLSSYGRQP
jgi:hypothetical protein